MLSTPHSDGYLVDLIYAALLGEASWETFLIQLSKTLPGGGSILFFHDANRGDGAYSVSGGFELGSPDAYDHFAKLNPWMPKAAIRPIGRGVVAEQMLPRKELVRTGFYNDFLRRIGLESAVGVTIVRSRGVSFMLSTLTSSDDADANMTEADRLTRLSPHLRRAFEYYRRTPPHRSILETAAAGFAVLDIGLIVIGDNGLVKFTTPAAQRMLEEDVGLKISLTGRLRVPGADGGDVVEVMTSRAFDGPPVRDLTTMGSHGPVRITLIRVGKDSISTFFEGPTVLVLVDPGHEARPRSEIDVLGASFGLTPAELRVFAKLVAGQTLREIAESVEVTYDTVRKQLKNIFAKTGVNRQAELIRLAGRLRPAAR